MKMSDEFTLPMRVNNADIDADDKYQSQFGNHMTAPSTADTTHKQDRYITHAVNNYDALVDVLTSMVDCMANDPKPMFAERVSAIELLKKIKGR